MAGKIKKKKKLTAVLWRAPITSAALNVTRLVFRTLWSEEVRAICHATLSFGRKLLFFYVCCRAQLSFLLAIWVRARRLARLRAHRFTHIHPRLRKKKKDTFFFEGAARSVVCGVSWQFKLVCVWLTVGELAVSRFFHLLPVNSSLLSSLYNTHTHIYTNINAQKKSQTSFILILVAWKPKENILIL